MRNKVVSDLKLTRLEEMITTIITTGISNEVMFENSGPQNMFATTLVIDTSGGVLCTAYFVHTYIPEIRTLKKILTRLKSRKYSNNCYKKYNKKKKRGFKHQHVATIKGPFFSMSSIDMDADIVSDRLSCASTKTPKKTMK